MHKLLGPTFPKSYHLQITMCSVFQSRAEATAESVYDLHVDSVPRTNRCSCPWFDLEWLYRDMAYCDSKLGY